MVFNSKLAGHQKEINLTRTSTVPFIMLIIFCVCSQATAQVESLEPTSALYYYSGTIGSTQQIEFNLQLKGQAVSGSYIVEASGDMFVFNGRMARDGKGIGVLIYDNNNIYIASLEANFISEASNFGKLLYGKWKSAGGKLTKDVKLKKVAEFASIPEEPVLYESALGD